MAIILWNLEQIDLNDAEATCLLAEDMIYNPSTPEYPMTNTYYPEDDYTLEEIERRLEEYRGDKV